MGFLHLGCTGRTPWLLAGALQMGTRKCDAECEVS